MRIDADCLFVICKKSDAAFNTRFVDDQLFTSREAAEIAIDHVKDTIAQKIKELKDLDINTILDFELVIITLSEFISAYGKTMYDDGKAAGKLDIVPSMKNLKENEYIKICQEHGFTTDSFAFIENGVGIILEDNSKCPACDKSCIIQSKIPYSIKVSDVSKRINKQL